MRIIPYLYDLQTGSRNKESINLNFLLKRLTCEPDDMFVLDGEEYDVPPFAAKFCSVPGRRNILALSSEDGDVLLMNTNYKANKSLIKRWKAHNNAIFDLCWLNDEYKIITASGDQQAILWNPDTETKLGVFKGHSSSIKCVSCQPNSKDTFATASRDGNIMIWDIRCNKNQEDNTFQPVITIRDAHNAASLLPGTPKHRGKKGVYNLSGNPLNSVTSITFQNENLLFSAGTADAVIKVWDLRKNYCNTKKEALPFKKFPYKGVSTKAHGYTSLVFNENHTLLYASCTDSVIYSYNCHSYNPLPLATYFGHKTSTFFVKMAINGDGKYLLSGSSDNKAYIWKISKPGRPFAQLIGHQAEVTAVAWSSNDFTKIVTCSDDVHVFFWDIKDNMDDEKEVLGLTEVVQSKQSHVLKSIENNDSATSVCLSPATSPPISSSTSPPYTVSAVKIFPEITRWFRPSGGSFLNSLPSIERKKLSQTNHSSHRKRRYSEITPNKETENSKQISQNLILPPDESRVLIPKKQENSNTNNIKPSANARRSLDMNSSQEVNGNASLINNLFTQSNIERNKNCLEENVENKLAKVNKDKHIKVLNSKQFGLITNYFSTVSSDHTN
ncbi:denticleless protein homolog [Centruroides sculpturatus]|uniref:denticleless protein homolog n=1 Tax=Centruroides sculpturatus TaxID=218467 RepID=UPI000C6E41C2|nr:denticleless protein homolog [Centruroides sculpturatus]